MTKQNYLYHFRNKPKITCPNCGKSHKFCPLVDEHGQIIYDTAGVPYGRCDREQNCGFLYLPNTNKITTKQNTPMTAPKLKPFVFAPRVIDFNYSIQNNFIQWLGTLHLNTLDIYKQLKMYNVCTTGADTVIWWQVSIAGVIRAGKIMHYDSNGHRMKNKNTTWAHKVAQFQQYMIGEELQQCFFGEHLLLNDSRPVAIVESEKTALLMSIIETKYIWLAAGGSQMLKNEERNAVLKGRAVCLFPDNGQFFAWNKIARANGWECVDNMEDPYFSGGKDIADLFTEIYGI